MTPAVSHPISSARHLTRLTEPTVSRVTELEAESWCPPTVGAPCAVRQSMRELVEYVTRTDSTYRVNYKGGVPTLPIPFFGDLEKAEVLTIGLNPSATEFESSRWRTPVDADGLTERLLRYFDSDEHPWFQAWERALGEIGASYRHNAAHLDISPRATVSAGAVPDPIIFEQMLVDDLPWMIRFMHAAPRARLILLAGVATKRHYLNEFLAKQLDANDGMLLGSLARPKGFGKVLHHVLRSKGRELPVYFCSSSPSDRRRPGLLLERVKRDAGELRQHLG